MMTTKVRTSTKYAASAAIGRSATISTPCLVKAARHSFVETLLKIRSVDRYKIRQFCVFTTL